MPKAPPAAFAALHTIFPNSPPAEWLALDFPLKTNETETHAARADAPWLHW
ncbi:hypothetical protein [Roseibium sp.]|uniref:hypothetical protein n=1 Tax=Roseibium sp. TaxID=1936156 RepID=UPI003BAC3602